MRTSFNIPTTQSNFQIHKLRKRTKVLPSLRKDTKNSNKNWVYSLIKNYYLSEIERQIQSISLHLPTQIRAKKKSNTYQIITSRFFKIKKINCHTDEISGNFISIQLVRTTQLYQLMQPHFIKHLMRHHRGERNDLFLSYRLILVCYYSRKVTSFFD